VAGFRQLEILFPGQIIELLRLLSGSAALDEVMGNRFLTSRLDLESRTTTALGSPTVFRSRRNV
jgi:hypothetical protein